MTLRQLEERLATVERELASLKESLPNGSRGSDWESTVGMFSGDEVMKRIDEHARRFREEDRRKARPRAGRTPPKFSSSQ